MTDERVVRLISIGTPVDKYTDYNYLENLTKPILFIHGDQDEFGKLENVEKLVERVARNTDAELISFENCGHFFDKHLNELREAVKNWTIGKL